MKRSEMVKQLAKWLDRSQSTVLMNGNEGKAESLLKQLEIWGMLPPVRTEKSVLPGISDFNVNTWEKENE